MKTYTIKPLVWMPDDHLLYSPTLVGHYAIIEASKNGELYLMCDGKSVGPRYRTLREAIAAAEAHYQSRLLEALEEVK